MGFGFKFRLSVTAVAEWPEGRLKGPGVTWWSEQLTAEWREKSDTGDGLREREGAGREGSGV